MDLENPHAIARIVIGLATVICLHAGISDFLGEIPAIGNGSPNLHDPAPILRKYVEATLILVFALAGAALLVNDIRG